MVSTETLDKPALLVEQGHVHERAPPGEQSAWELTFDLKLPKREVAEDSADEEKAEQQAEHQVEEVVGGVDRGEPDADRDEEERAALACQPKLPPAPPSSKDPHRSDRSERDGHHGEELANHALRVVANRHRHRHRR